MTYTYQDFENAANKAGLLGQFSQYDLDLARQYPEAGLSILSLKQDYANATTPEQRALANEGANQIRNSYGNYTANDSGAGYISTGRLPSQIDDVLGQIGSYGPFNYANNSQYQQALDAVTNAPAFSFEGTAPVYTNTYAQQQKALLDAVLNREGFNWSKETDPVYGSYAKQYRREGDRATANALAQASAASGGRASSYAMNAATQAGDYYATKLSDIIPTLYQQAYDRYLQEYQMKLSDLNAVNTQEQLDYNRYLTDLGQFNTDRNFALDSYNTDTQQRLNALNALNADREFSYNDYLNQFNMLQSYLGNLQGQDATEYSRHLDQIAQRQQEQQYADAMAQQALENQMALAEIGAGLGDFGGMNALGITPNTENIYKMALANAARVTPVGSGGGGNGGGGTPNTTTTPATDPVAAFNGGDQSDEVIQALLDMGYTQEDIVAAGYTGSYFGANGKGSAPSSSTNPLTSFDFNEDEGIFTWNGKQYSSMKELESDLNAYIFRGIITPKVEEEIKRKMAAYGINS